MSSFTEITEKAKESLREVHEVIDKSCNSDSIADKMFGIALAKKTNYICEQLVEESIDISSITKLASKIEDKHVPKFHYSETSEDGYTKIDDNSQFVLPSYHEIK